MSQTAKVLKGIVNTTNAGTYFAFCSRMYDLERRGKKMVKKTNSKTSNEPRRRKSGLSPEVDALLDTIDF